MRSVLLYYIVVTVLASLAFSDKIVPNEGQDKPSFDVISIRPVRYDDQRAACAFRPGGRFRAHCDLRLLIAVAYEIDHLRVLDVSGFVDKYTWDIEAKPEEGKYPLKNGLLDHHVGNLMIQSMLEDRFKVKTHRETRLMSGYELTIAKTGPKLKDAEGDKASIERGDGIIKAHYLRVSDLARFIEIALNRTVVDKTGIQGRYDLELTWTPEKGIAAVGVIQNMSVDPEITILDAIQEQVGLKLTPQKVSTEFLVVDDVQMPSAN